MSITLDLPSRYLRALRKARWATQRDAARDAQREGLIAPYPFIAHLESVGLPVTVAKFLRFTVLLEMEAMTLEELSRAVMRVRRLGARSVPVGVIFKALRTQCHLTQSMLATRSQQSETPISKAFIARLESGRVPNTLVQTIQYASLLKADLDLLRELGSIVPPRKPEAAAGSYATILPRIVAHSRSGRHGKALGLCLSLMDDPSRSENERAKALLCAAIVMANRGSWRASRYLAEQTLAATGCDDALRANALVQLIWVDTEAGDGHNVEALASQLQRISGKSAEAEALCWFHLAYARLTHEDAEAASGALERAYAVRGFELSPDRLLPGLVTLARVRARLGNKKGACAAIHQLEAQLHSASAEMRGVLLINSADAAIAIGELVLARELLRRGIGLATELGNKRVLLRGQVGLCEVALARNDITEAKGLIRLINAHSFDAGVDRPLQSRIRELRRKVRADAAGR